MTVSAAGYGIGGGKEVEHCKASRFRNRAAADLAAGALMTPTSDLLSFSVSVSLALALALAFSLALALALSLSHY